MATEPTQADFERAAVQIIRIHRRQQMKALLVRYRWVIGVALTVAPLFLLAWSFRYEPMPPEEAMWVRVWDRWYQRVCVTPNPQITDVAGLACSQSDIAVLLTQMQAEAAARQERERPAREASQRAQDEFFRQQQAGLERDKKAWAVKQERAEALRNTISKYVQPRDFLGAPDRWVVNKLRQDGHTEEYISQQVMPFRNRLLAAGAPKEIADEYFGGDPFLTPGVKP